MPSRRRSVLLSLGGVILLCLASIQVETSYVVSSLLDPMVQQIHASVTEENPISATSSSFSRIYDNQRYIWNSSQDLQDEWNDPSRLFHQSLCLPQSNFRSVSGSLSVVQSLYWAFYRHQHSQCDRFLVTSLPNMGMGATFRNGAVNALLTAIHLNRTLIVLSQTDSGPQFLQNRWDLAPGDDSCHEYPNYQCFFRPLTHCTLGLSPQDVLNAATVLNQRETRLVLHGKPLAADHPMTNASVVVFQTWDSLVTRMVPPMEIRIRKRLWSLVHTEVPLHLESEFLEVGHHNDNCTTAIYNKCKSSLHHAAILFILRPNPDIHRILQQHVQDSLDPFPQERQPDLGFPIRSSDKCLGESECLSVSMYMQMAHELLNTSEKPVIVLTSEAKHVLKERHAYNQSFEFLINPHDVMQNTGRPKRFSKKNTTAKDIMISTLVALQLQLQASHIVANCCSNFHVLLMDLAREGCGVPHQTFACLQQLDNPDYHLCCHWKPDCQVQVKKQFQERANNQTRIAV